MAFFDGCLFIFFFLFQLFGGFFKILIEDASFIMKNLRENTFPSVHFRLRIFCVFFRHFKGNFSSYLRKPLTMFDAAVKYELSVNCLHNVCLQTKSNKNRIKIETSARLKIRFKASPCKSKSEVAKLNVTLKNGHEYKFD